MNMKKIYRKIAKEHGVSVEEVEREMKMAIDMAYAAPKNDGITQAYQNQMTYRGNAPTPEEVIRHIAKKVK